MEDECKYRYMYLNLSNFHCVYLSCILSHEIERDKQHVFAFRTHPVPVCCSAVLQADWRPGVETVTGGVWGRIGQLHRWRSGGHCVHSPRRHETGREKSQPFISQPGKELTGNVWACRCTNLFKCYLFCKVKRIFLKSKYGILCNVHVIFICSVHYFVAHSLFVHNRH